MGENMHIPPPSPPPPQRIPDSPSLLDLAGVHGDRRGRTGVGALDGILGIGHGWLWWALDREDVGERAGWRPGGGRVLSDFSTACGGQWGLDRRGPFLAGEWPAKK